MNMSSLSEVTERLESLFSTFNEHIFDGAIQKPIIAVQPNGVRNSRRLGWCTMWKAWNRRDGSEGYYEINLCAEYLARPLEETCATLIHEMVHLFNLQNGVQDCSRGNYYHNKNFKEAAERHGLLVEHRDCVYGWAFTRLNDETSAWVRENLSDKEISLYWRRFIPEGELVVDESGALLPSCSSTIKYVCPGCGTIIRATREVRVTCTDCKLPFERFYARRAS